MIDEYVKCSRCGKKVKSYITFSATAKNVGNDSTTDVAMFNLSQFRRTLYGREKTYCIKCGIETSKELI